MTCKSFLSIAILSFMACGSFFKRTLTGAVPADSGFCLHYESAPVIETAAATFRKYLLLIKSIVEPKILNNLSIPSLNYFKIRRFTHV